MSVRSGCCCINSDSCLVGNNNRRSARYYGIIRPLAFFVVTTLLGKSLKKVGACCLANFKHDSRADKSVTRRNLLVAMTVSHVCDKFSANSSFRMIKTDLTNLRKHLSTLSMEMKNIVEMREELKSKLREVSIIIPKISEAIHQLRDEVSEDIGVHSQSAENMRHVVKSELRMYDADKTGHTDYALEALGGSIISIRDTETYDAGSSTITVFGISLCQSQNRPQSIIQTGVLPGQCWSFKGSSGCVVIKLLGSVHISSVSLEHISADMAPTSETTSAPRDFTVWGLRNADDTDGFLLGEFTYDNCASPVQNFPVQHEPQEPYEIVEVKFHSNSGNPDYTCVYRIRVHGTLNQ